MQIVFMNQMSRTVGNENMAAAQVWIGEEEGAWRAGWRETGQDGHSRDEAWYEGGSWEELLCVYRHGLAQKLGEGYRPVIEGVFHEPEEIKGRNHAALKLQCYSETHASEELYAELCAWRRRKAAAGRKAPYFIASNRVLRLISTFVPQTLEELLQLPGIGSSKAGEHGAEWLEITSRAERTTAFPLDWVLQELKDDEFRSWLYKQKEQKYKQELEHFRMSRTMLTGIREGLTLDQLSGKTGLSRRAIVELLEGLEKEGYDTELLIRAELASMPEEEQQDILQAYEELGDTFLKPVLQRVYGQEKAEGGDLEQVYERLRLIRITFRRTQSPKRNAG
ncbi:HRDC domain-containing protein [Paenibacillus sp. DMB20]|uniref:HRDC domain-containing protein n=1 Tax=Paenibacillus sp. DMB20 TaxID=1642570 RepID=UPI000627ECA7|nr:HRDC domain-containing protein [Paenibacillus sp. DMB20]KKO53610.1 helicase [Paenibacillus sp. DMB20]